MNSPKAGGEDSLAEREVGDLGGVARPAEPISTLGEDTENREVMTCSQSSAVSDLSHHKDQSKASSQFELSSMQLVTYLGIRRSDRQS